MGERSFIEAYFNPLSGARISKSENSQITSLKIVRGSATAINQRSWKERVHWLKESEFCGLHSFRTLRVFETEIFHMGQICGRFLLGQGRWEK